MSSVQFNICSYQSGIVISCRQTAVRFDEAQIQEPAEKRYPTGDVIHLGQLILGQPDDT